MSEVESWLAGYLPARGDVAVDVGANIGSWTAALADRFKRVVAVEPNPQALPMLRRVAESHLNVEVVEAAAGAECGSVLLNLFVEAGHASVFDDTTLETLPRGAATGAVEVRVVSLDSFGLASEPVEFVKIDVEGAERRVVEGASGLLSARRPALLIETHTVANRDWLLGRLPSYGYEPAVLPHPVSSVPEGHGWVICGAPSSH